MLHSGEAAAIESAMNEMALALQARADTATRLQLCAQSSTTGAECMGITQQQPQAEKNTKLFAAGAVAAGELLAAKGGDDTPAQQQVFAAFGAIQTHLADREAQCVLALCPAHVKVYAAKMTARIRRATPPLPGGIWRSAAPMWPNVFA